MLKSIHRLITLLLVFLFVSSPLLAQQRRNTAPRKPPATEAPAPVPTFDTLLSAESYKVYCEVRGLGGFIRSSAVTDLLDPVMKLGGPPKEFKTLVKWLNAHADILAGSRMLVAGWPSRPKLPAILVAIEFSSPEDAKKFYPELRGFLSTLLPTPTPTPSPTREPAPKRTPAISVGSPDTPVIAAEPVIVPMTPPQQIGAVPEQERAPVLPPYQIKQAGSLVLISDTAFTFRSLKPRGSKPLEEDQNFMMAQNRFASESIFLYVDVKSIEKEEKERQKKWEEEEQKRIESEAANPPKAEEARVEMETEVTTPTTVEDPQPPEPEPSSSSEPTLVGTTADPQVSRNGTLSGGPVRGTDEVSPMIFSLYGAFFGGETKWPEAVAAAIAFEGDAYVLRTLVVNGAENKPNAIPFVPQFVSGPALVPESPNIFPADTDLFVSVSLDYPQVYDGMLKSIAHAEEMARKYAGQPVKDSPPPESPFAIYEKKLGLKIKDDLLPLLGNELALALPKVTTKESKATPANPSEENQTPENTEQNKARAAEPNPVIAISVKDKEAVARLLPKIIESLGFKGANLFAQTEKRDGTEITSYGNVFAYAFVGDFLIVSPDPAATRHVVDSYLNHQTLSSDSHFRNFTRWQPRQVLGQVYVAPGLVKQYTSGSAGLGVPVDDKMNEFLSRVNPVIDPLTYALSNDGLGPLHELHVPKSLLQLMIAGASREAGQPPRQMNEAMAQTALQSLAGSEASFQAEKGAGRYGTLDELLSEHLVSKELLEKYGYRIDLIAAANKFAATAVPVEYGKTGRLSYFIDESGVLRAGDHGGGAATIADQPVE